MVQGKKVSHILCRKSRDQPFIYYFTGLQVKFFQGHLYIIPEKNASRREIIKNNDV
jgi:hypothetical protein